MHCLSLVIRAGATSAPYLPPDVQRYSKSLLLSYSFNFCSEVTTVTPNLPFARPTPALTSIALRQAQAPVNPTQPDRK